MNNSNLNLTTEQVDYFLSPKAIRESAAKIYRYVESGKSHFQLHLDKLDLTVDYVLEVIQKNYPDLNIPFHSRWGHFRVGGVDRVTLLEEKLKTQNSDALEMARVKLDLVITSVLLDAGAGAGWSYLEESTGKVFSRSEGLGVASYYLFLSGLMSHDKKSLRVDAAGLSGLSEEHINQYFQVSEKNPLLGVSGRLQLLNNLAKALEVKTIFKDGRPGNIIDYLISKHGNTIPAVAILRAVLDGLGPIWPGRLSAQGVSLGDVWQHQGTGELIAFHKLSQWMTYSLIEPIMQAGIVVTGVDQLTGLAEYRNGGLLIDIGLISVKNEKELESKWLPSSDFIIEWRALTIYFLDIIGARIQRALKKTSDEFPLAKVLEGGTWWAGRFLAQQKRVSGDPPVQLQSDGTVF
ncbi:MAG: uracil phosphoribosyltransferase [Bdellovibrionales bacterium RIFCSPHIGHO2_01_FULL_40_29]|nr:MAG: uracil phosphoribosyltransferase [Bdellovibrionales bacterium RIFCSPHIGHO2_01_FULL_40_29]OFZ33628.1 MAG: uracil phosphoribosyltransferase [Bdellovibrionales bacterium RIFCSPHIGHO2_02_FULL_40_15]